MHKGAVIGMIDEECNMAEIMLQKRRMCKNFMTRALLKN